MKIKTSFVTNSSTCNFIMIARKISKNEALTFSPGPTERKLILMQKNGGGDGPIVMDDYCEIDIKEINEDEYDIYDCPFYTRFSSDDYSESVLDLDLHKLPVDHLSEYKMISTFECC